MIDNKATFKKTKAVPENTIKDYGKYGQYQKQKDGKWKRLKKGYPAFRKTLDYKLMKSFLCKQGECENFLDKHGVKTLRSMIKSKGMEDQYKKWLEENNGKEI